MLQLQSFDNSLENSLIPVDCIICQPLTVERVTGLFISVSMHTPWGDDTGSSEFINIQTVRYQCLTVMSHLCPINKARDEDINPP